MIEAGEVSQTHWGEGNWIFLDIGFSHRSRTTGLLIGDGDPEVLQFGAARERVVQKIGASAAAVNLVIEAPLSVAFDSRGNPKGRSVEKDGSKTRYWYNGLGCAVMVAAMYLIRSLYDSEPSAPVRLFEGFISYKDRNIPSDHRRDVLLLREVVCNPTRFAQCIYGVDQLKQDPDDELSSAFCVAGMDCGVPALIRRDG